MNPGLEPSRSIGGGFIRDRGPVRRTAIGDCIPAAAARPSKDPSLWERSSRIPPPTATPRAAAAARKRQLVQGPWTTLAAGLAAGLGGDAEPARAARISVALWTSFQQVSQPK